jgi:serine/threonine-protein kinase
MRKKAGSYEIEERIGQGGMGVVYRGRQPALDRPVILKQLRADLDGPEDVERFLREARVVASVHHQNVVGVYDCFAAHGRHYIVQEFVDGADLASILERSGPFPPRVAALVALCIVSGLEEVHSRGIVHRDLKPSNVLVGKTGEIKIADFGIAFEARLDGLTRPGVVIGSPPYVSPEQMQGEKACPRSDFFCLGIVLYEMLTGHLPFPPASEDESDESWLVRVRRGRYPRARRRAPHVPRWLDRLIRRCLQARRERRPAAATDVRRLLARRLGRPSPADLRDEIAAFLWSEGAFETAGDETRHRAAATSTSQGRTWRWHLRWAAPALVATLAGGGLLGSSMGLTTSGEDASTAPAPAPAREIVAPAVADARPASVRVVVDPWASVRVDERDAFHTPRAKPLELAPGRHVLVIAHPQLGRVEKTIDVKPGENVVVSHVFGGEGSR